MYFKIILLLLYHKLILLHYYPVVRSDRFETIFEWQYLNFTWPSQEAYQTAISSGKYIPENNVFSGLKIYEDRIYLTLPKFRKGVPITLAYISQNSSNQRNEPLRPFPSWEMNDQETGCATLQSVESMEIDTSGNMWVIDGMRIMDASKCPAKLLVLDLTNDGDVVQSYTFPESISSKKGGYLNDIVVDEVNGEYAYITDNSFTDPGLIVYSRLENRSWKFRDGSMKANILAAFFIINGFPLFYPGTIDGIALSPKRKGTTDKTVYYTALSSFNLYSISSTILRNETMTEVNVWKRGISLVIEKNGQSDGIVIDNEGNLYITLLPKYGVEVYNIYERSSRILDTNRTTIIFPAAFAFDMQGYLYLTSNMLYKYALPFYPLKITEEIKMRILKAYTGTKSYLYN